VYVVADEFDINFVEAGASVNVGLPYVFEYVYDTKAPFGALIWIEGTRPFDV
jgi:hypothetical protein